VVAIHTNVLPDGRVLTWSRLEDAQVWDPATNVFTNVRAPSWIFCAGQTFLPDGRLLVAGGHITDDHGLRDVNVFDFTTNKWSPQPPMRAGRWYPTVLALPNGEQLVVAGATELGASNAIPEVRGVDGTWRELTSAQLDLPYYPFMFVAPDGRAYMAGTHPLTRFLDTSGTGRWITGPYTSSRLVRNYGSALMYEAGKVMLIGGGITPTNNVETIDLNVPRAAYQPGPPLAFARRQLNATVLPDGQVLVTGGSSAPGFNNASGAVLVPELWNPTSNTWRKLAPMKVPRIYHSTAVLLLDGRVLSGGGGEGGGGTVEKNMEIFSPPYLFAADGTLAPRPQITSAPAQVAYNQSFDIATPDAGAIAQVTLIRLPSTTHGTNMNQRLVRLAFALGADKLTATAPLNAALAPPGHYMLWIVNANGVPSVAKVLKVG
jgi:hypothetical protein